MKKLTFALTIVLACRIFSTALAEPISFNNDSAKGVKGFIPIQSVIPDKPAQKSEIPLLTNVPPDSSQQFIEAKSQPQKITKFQVIDINGPKAPRIVPGTLIKKGPRSVNGKSIKIVEFWATWCGPCRQTIPILSQAQEIYGKKNVVIMGFSDEDDEKLVRSYVKDNGSKMNYTVRLDPRRRTYTPYSSIWNVNSIPHAYVVSHNGKILWHGNPGNARVFERAIQEAIVYRDGSL